MATSRHQRRKAAKLRNKQRTENIRLADEAWQRQALVKRNMSEPIERNYYSSVRTCLAGIEGMSHRGYVCRAGGAMSKRGAEALRSKGSWKPFKG